ncbi:hypothetical protein OG736_45970 (plasmid) [Streptomyces sp. NBC_01334]|nr:hypothetical protein OG736_45970 [Streptomyces sp. NBC_01334]
MLPQLEKASRARVRTTKVLFEELELVEQHGADLDAAALWRAVEEVAPRAVVMSAATFVVSLVPEDEDSAAVAPACTPWPSTWTPRVPSPSGQRGPSAVTGGSAWGRGPPSPSSPYHRG